MPDVGNLHARSLAGRGLALTFLALAVLAALACAGAAAGLAAEVEPNNAPAAATVAPPEGNYVVQGETDAVGDAFDYYSFTLTAATVLEAKITNLWSCADLACENITVLTQNGQPLLDPDGQPITGDYVYFSGLSGELFYLQVRGGNPGGRYSIEVTAHPFLYSSGERVDIKEANTSAAIVTLAFALDKDSTYPYPLSYEGENVYFGYALTALVLNWGPRDLTVVLPAGLFWVAEDSLYTNYVVTRTQEILVPRWSVIDAGIIVAADSPYGWVPGDPSRPGNSPWYYLGSNAGGDLAKVVHECDIGTYSFETEQIAVWAVTAGQSKADFDKLDASTRAYNEARTLLQRANVGTAITPSTSRTTGALLSLFSLWPFCFALLFVGIPVLFGLTQAARAVKLASRQIDNAYTVDRSRIREAARERRQYIKDARRRERERARERRAEERAARANRPAPTPQAPPPPPGPVPLPALASSAATPFKRFMAADSHENFDLDELNALDFNAVLAEAVAGKETAALATKKGEELRQRLRQDVGDPDTIDDILRNRILVWVRTSGAKPTWAEDATHAWAGLVAESATAGGRRRAALETRFAALQDACDSKGKWFKPKPRVEAPGSRKVGATPESDPALLKAVVTQAVLDDLAARPKSGDQPFPLPILSELAARYSPQRVNNALAEMFKAEPRGPFVVLHPSRYPDCDITAIRPPAQGAKAGAMSYDLYFAKAAAAVPASAPGGFVASSGPIPGLLDTSGALWTRDNVSKEEWSAVLAELQRQRQRLDPPPGNYRKLPAYFTLRQLLVADNNARLAFIGTKWRGKPVGLPLLCQLLVDKSFVPEYDTDREYFEAELGDLERGDANYLSASGSWTIAPGLVVKRSGGETGQFTYSV